MALLTLIARASDGLPLSASVLDDEVLVDTYDVVLNIAVQMA